MKCPICKKNELEYIEVIKVKCTYGVSEDGYINFNDHEEDDVEDGNIDSYLYCSECDEEISFELNETDKIILD